MPDGSIRRARLDDTVDAAIVREISLDARATLAHLSERVGLSVSAVQSRLRRLEARGIVRGYRPVLDAEALGRPLAAFVEITPLDPAQPDNAPDWGTERRKVLFEQCVECHMTSQGTRTGVQSMPSIVHMGGVDAGAQPAIVHPLDPKDGDVQARRVVHFKEGHETYRRLLDYLNR